MFIDNIFCDDSLHILQSMGDRDKVDLIYMDPPFFTQQTQRLKTRDNSCEYSFEDHWRDIDEYISYIELRLKQCHRILKDTGSIFLHCDRNAVHYLKVCMDRVFGADNFQSEVIWYYRRWSNARKGLLNNHQVILFYSKSKDFKFNRMFTDYSPTTNIDQILQDRVRDSNGKSTYKVDAQGEAVISNGKRGVPLSDVWEIPYLNPKAKERVGYPTQKPILLLEQIIKLVTDEGDIVLDPFMGSGTTLVAAKLLKRHYIGIDKSEDAVALAGERLEHMVKTDSPLMKKGRAAYQRLSEESLQVLKLLKAVPVQRNKGIDGFLSELIDGKPVSVRIQRDDELLFEAINMLVKASQKKKCGNMVLVRTHVDLSELYSYDNIPENVIIIDHLELQLNDALSRSKNMSEIRHWMA